VIAQADGPELAKGGFGRSGSVARRKSRRLQTIQEAIQAGGGFIISNCGMMPLAVSDLSYRPCGKIPNARAQQTGRYDFELAILPSGCRWLLTSLVHKDAGTFRFKP